MRFIVTLLAMLMTFCGHAEESFPQGCKPIVVNGETVKLSTEKPTLAMIHNLSKIDLWITHPMTEANASAGWSSHLQAGNWSALAFNMKTFELSCIESRPGHEQQVPCSGVIAICQWSTVGMPEKTQGTFWAGEDQKLASLLAYIGSRGFKVP